MSNTTFYIAGPISGAGSQARERFHDTAHRLTAQGFRVLNPAALPLGLQEHQYMDICLAMIRASDAIWLLPGWRHSKGATAEYHYAVKLGLHLHEEPHHDHRPGTAAPGVAAV